jgi:Winged helix DNA-binding domain
MLRTLACGRACGILSPTISLLIVNRRVVRIALMRSTVHLVSAHDCAILRPLLESFLQRNLVSSAFGRQVAGVGFEALVAVARRVLEERPRTGPELAESLREYWPDRDGTALTYAVRNLVPMVQLPPRGVWGAGGRLRTTTDEEWLGRALDPDPSLEEVFTRYLRAFGPAGVKDFQTWSGLTGVREELSALRPVLRVFIDEEGRELFDVADGPLPDPDTAAPVRFIAEYDNLLLSHADRARIVSDGNRRRPWSRNGIVPGTILVDGFVAGTWQLSNSRSQATLNIQAFHHLSSGTLEELESEGEKLLAFAVADARARRVIFDPLD